MHKQASNAHLNYQQMPVQQQIKHNSVLGKQHTLPRQRSCDVTESHQNPCPPTGHLLPSSTSSSPTFGPHCPQHSDLGRSTTGHNLMLSGSTLPRHSTKPIHPIQHHHLHTQHHEISAIHHHQYQTIHQASTSSPPDCDTNSNQLHKNLEILHSRAQYQHQQQQFHQPTILDVNLELDAHQDMLDTMPEPPPSFRECADPENPCSRGTHGVPATLSPKCDVGKDKVESSV